MEQFKAQPGEIRFFTYGDTLYSPTKTVPPDDLIRHEETHAEQQNHNDGDAKKWWDRYFVDEDFRVHQEAEAYAEQYKWIIANSRHGKDRNVQARLLNRIASLLASSTYGNAISHSDAFNLIKAYADGKALNGIEDHMPDVDV